MHSSILTLNGHLLHLLAGATIIKPTYVKVNAWNNIIQQKCVVKFVRVLGMLEKYKYGSNYNYLGIFWVTEDIIFYLDIEKWVEFQHREEGNTIWMKG